MSYLHRHWGGSHGIATMKVAQELAEELPPFSGALRAMEWMDTLIRRTGGEHWWTAKTDNTGLPRSIRL